MQVLTKPGAATFAAELDKAEWRSVWVQLLGWGFITAIVGFIAWLISPITINVLSVLLAKLLSPAETLEPSDPELRDWDFLAASARVWLMAEAITVGRASGTKGGTFGSVSVTPWAAKYSSTRALHDLG